MRSDRPWRRRVADAGLVLLLVATVVLVLRAFETDPVPAGLATVDSTPPPTTITTPPTGRPTGGPATVAPKGLSLEAVDDRTAFRIATGQDCAAAAAVPIERTTDGGRRWESRATPLRRVAGVAFVSPALGYAAGLGATCRPEIYRTDDSGDTWTPLAYSGDEVVALDATGDSAWLLLRATGVTATGSRITRTTDSFRTLRSVPDPCVDGPATAAPTAIALLDAGTAWVACTATARPEGQPRLLLATANAGSSWDELSGARRVGPADGGRRDGLDGDGMLLGIDVTAGGRMHALLGSAGCPEGQLRRSADSGRNWTPLPCVSASQPLDSLLAVSFTGPDAGWMVGTRGPALVTLRTTDSGRSWTAAG